MAGRRQAVKCHIHTGNRASNNTQTKIAIAPFSQETVEGAPGKVLRPHRGGIPRHHGGDPLDEDWGVCRLERGRQRRG